MPPTDTPTPERALAEMTLEELDRQWSKRVADYIYKAGKSRADCVATDTGVMSFADWTLEALARRDAARTEIARRSADA